jgi:hypothetical protein
MSILGNPEVEASGHTVQPLTAHTPAEPLIDTGRVKYYALDERNGSMHRRDGTRLAFINGVLATSLKADQDYLDGELANNHPVLRVARPDEIQVYEMKRDPKGTIAREIRPQLEAQIRAELEAKIRKEMGVESLQAEVGSVDAANLDADRIAGAGAGDAAVDMLQRLRSGSASVVMTSQRPPLQGIVSSADLGGAEAGSSGQSGSGATNANATK